MGRIQMTTQAKIWSDKFKQEQLNKINLLKKNGVNIMDTTIKNNDKMKLYAIVDLDIGILDVFQQPNDILAKRNFMTQVNTEKTPFNMFPDRFEVWAIGEIAKDTGLIENEVRVIAKASELKNA